MGFETIAINRLSSELPLVDLFLLAIIGFLSFIIYSLYTVLKSERKFWIQSNKNLQDRIDSLLDQIQHL